jgi:hypothetical protein
LLESSADKYSELAGEELVARKVSELVVMGGEYPSGYEYNFFSDDASATAHVVNNWPTMITFLGFEVGVSVLTGTSLIKSDLNDDPVRQAYIYYNHGKPRESWDPLTVYYAIYGLGDLFEYGSESGYCHVFPNGSNEWRQDENRTKHRPLKLKVDPSIAQATIDNLFLEGARRVG